MRTLIVLIFTLISFSNALAAESANPEVISQTATFKTSAGVESTITTHDSVDPKTKIKTFKTEYKASTGDSTSVIAIEKPDGSTTKNAVSKDASGTVILTETARATVDPGTKDTTITTQYWDGSGSLQAETISKKDPFGKVTDQTRDAKGALVAEIQFYRDSEGNEISDTKLSNGYFSTRIEGPKGNVSIEIVGPEGKMKKLWGTDKSLISTVFVDKQGNTWTNAFDAKGKTITVETTDGIKITKKYGPDSKLLSSVAQDAKGHPLSEEDIKSLMKSLYDKGTSLDEGGRNPFKWLDKTARPAYANPPKDVREKVGRQ